MGTNTGAITAHFADALPMKRLIPAETRMKESSSGRPVKPAARSRIGAVDGDDEAEVGPAEVGDELGGREGEHDVAAEHGDRVGRHLRDVTVGRMVPATRP
jgi:hypothetical protein